MILFKAMPLNLMTSATEMKRKCKPVVHVLHHNSVILEGTFYTIAECAKTYTTFKTGSWLGNVQSIGRLCRLPTALN